MKRTTLALLAALALLPFGCDDDKDTVKVTTPKGDVKVTTPARTDADRAADKIEDKAEKAGDKIEDAADKAGDKIEDAGDKAKDAMD
jgi:hypothetical protein